MIFGLMLGVGVGLVGTRLHKKRKQQHLIASVKQSRPLTHVQKTTLPSTDTEEDKAKKNFLLASGGTLLTIGGSLVYAPLYIPGMLLIAYPFRDTVKDAYHALVKEKRVGVDMLLAVDMPVCIIAGYPAIGALGLWFQRLMRLQLAKTQNHSRRSLVNLFGEQPRTVWVLLGGSEQQEEIEIPFEEVKPDDRVIVTAGQTIPVDGLISEGMASIDQRMLTGESQPPQLGEQDKVFAGTVVLSGQIIIRVTQAGTQTLVAQIGDVLNNTADFDHSMRSRVEKMQDKMAPQLFLLSGMSIPLIGVSSAMSIFWYHPGFRMTIFGPMSMVNFLRICSQKRILIKDGRSLEHLSEIDTVVFDKTGTLTIEQPIVSQIYHFETFSDSELLAFAAAAEHKQSHPVARAILDAAEGQGLLVPSIDDTYYEVGYGIKVQVQLPGATAKTIHVGSDRFMQMENIIVPPEAIEQQAICHENGYSLIMIAVDGLLSGAIELRPTLRPEAQQIVSTLQAAGKSITIISGDHEKPTRQLAEALGIDQYFAGVLPEGKAERVKQLQQAGKKVCFVGDGINDAIALKQADVSVSLSGASTIATDSAQIVLMDENLTRLPEMFTLAEEFKTSMNTTYLSTVVPSSLGIVGTLFLHWGFVAAVLLNILLWLPQLVYVMYPIYKHKTPSLPDKNNNQLITDSREES